MTRHLFITISNAHSRKFNQLIVLDKIILDIFAEISAISILKNRPLHIAFIMTFSLLYLSAPGSLEVCAQNIVIPERWHKDFNDIPPLFKADSLTLCFIGDVMMHASQLENALKSDSTYDFSSYFRFISQDISSADIAVANMEFALGGEPYTGYPSFSAPDEIAIQMAENGIDIFLAANNHIYDRGRSGAERTLKIYKDLMDSHGVSFTGLSSCQADLDRNNPLMLIRKGFRLAFINFTYDTNGGKREGWPKVNYMDRKGEIADAIAKAGQQNADVVTALPHWGVEYMLSHSSEQEENAGWLISQGVDLIVGTHPHVIQDSTFMNGCPVLYSLGNAVSNMSAAYTQLGLMAKIRIERDEYGEISICRPELTFLWCSHPGGFSREYTLIPVERYIGKKELWTNKTDYEKMISTYERARKATGIK